ncbi:hypothetical protein FCV25MIE_08129 [Fagus crenata]
MSTLSISDEKNNEGNGIPLRTRETNTFPVANSSPNSSPSLSHENNKVSTNVNYFSMSRSEAQATIPGVDSALCPSFARIEEMDEKNNDGNDIPLGTTETITFPVANSSQSLSHENNEVSTNVNYFSMSRSEAQVTIPGVDSALCPSFARIEEMDEKNNDGNDIPLGTTETITFPVANSSQSLSHENNEVSTNVNYFSMSRSEAQVTVPGVDSALCPSFARIEEMEDKSSKLSHISLVRAPVGHLRKKLLILDLNGLLADIVQPAPKNYKPDFKFAGRAIFKRPFCQDFLKFCFERFEVGVWSSRIKYSSPNANWMKNVTRVTDYLLGDMKHKLLLCWSVERFIERFLIL